MEIYTRPGHASPGLASENVERAPLEANLKLHNIIPFSPDHFYFKDFSIKCTREWEYEFLKGYSPKPLQNV
jgi:hypothetical protein